MAPQKYDFRKIEKKWQNVWKKTEIYKTPDKARGKENLYTSVEFPYPSGNLHTGHWYAFSVPDIYARFKRMCGFNVLFPIGFDSFGLPAENAAIKRGINPRKWTYGNINFMRKQLCSMGASFDWSREVITSDPEYYKWTQWLFLQFFKKGLAYQAETAVNWCPTDKTVLANEQVVDNCCERCGSEIERRRMKQWLIKITDYAERLINDLEKLNWPEEIKEAQKNWIGRSEGAVIEFKIQNSKFKILAFTTRPDTIFGATYMVLARENSLVKNLESRILNLEEVKRYVEKAGRKTELQRQEEAKDKTGVELKGVKAINPATKEEIPVWVADYVLGSVGTGAIMAVPAHDERDRQFAEKFNLPIVDKPLVGRDEIVKKVGGEKKTQYRLRDWVVSRQRYWGCPIPIVHCSKCGAVPVAEWDLPVKLPPIKDYKPTGDGRSPLAKAEKWVKTKCPKCKSSAERETDTLDTFVDSSWYYLAYLAKNKSRFQIPDSRFKTWMPMDLYSGGVEHTTMHLLYSRFFYKAMHDLGLIPKEVGNEPYAKRLNRGLILGLDGQKMSKSRGNVADPDQYVHELGADSVRMYLAFIGPYNEVGAYPWDPHGILGVHRFLQRVWKLIQNAKIKNQNDNSKLKNNNLERLLHKTIKKVGEDIENFKFNTAISALMILLNEFEKSHELGIKNYEVFLKLLAPFAPHMTEELWQETRNKKQEPSIHLESWPKYNPKLIKEDTFTLVIQINGKTRDTVEAPADTTEEEVKKISLGREKVIKHIGFQEPRKIIYIPKRLINIVI